MADMNDKRALIAFCREMLGTRNVIGTNLEDVEAEAVEREFVQDRSGVRVQFRVSNHFLGKVTNKDLSGSMRVMLPEG